MAASSEPRIRIGTSGYVYPHWREIFYPRALPSREWLGFYAERFDTVELNNTFYRLPTAKAVEGWAQRAPRGFLFAVKGSRFLTHIKRLKDTGAGLARFFEAVAPLGARLGPVLWQLPPTMKPDVPRLSAFLAALPARPACVVELRHADWYRDDVFQAIADAGASLCLHDLVDAPAPFPPPGSLYYRRFHGPRGSYAGRYGRERLRSCASEIASLARSGRRCFAYFNNDAAGAALLDALDLRALVGATAGDPAGARP